MGQQGRPALRPRRGGRGARPHGLRARVHDGELRWRDPARSCRRSPPSSGRAAARSALGDYDPAMLVHGEQSIRLHGELPVGGDGVDHDHGGRHVRQGRGRPGRARERVAARRQRRAGLLTRTSLFIRGAGGFGGPRNPEGDDESALAAEPLPTREPDEVVSYCDAGRSGAALPVERRPQSAALRPDLRQAGRLRRARSCTACAPTASPGAPCSTRCAARTRHASAPCAPASPSRPCPVTR